MEICSKGLLMSVGKLSLMKLGENVIMVHKREVDLSGSTTVKWLKNFQTVGAKTVFQVQHFRHRHCSTILCLELQKYVWRVLLVLGPEGCVLNISSMPGVDIPASISTIILLHSINIAT